MYGTARKTVATFAALAALALGGSAIAGAAQSGGSSPSSMASGSQPGQPARPHQANGRTEEALTGDTAAKVKAAALKKVSGTLERVETNVDSSAPYEAHIRKADGTEVEVQVSKDFAVTAVNSMQHP